jgi:transcription elongation GreA/GreB family factor
MDAELKKLAEAGTLNSKQAEQLEKLKPGTFCLHKSWGFGRVAEWNLLLNQIVIDFTGKKSHPMQLSYAAENLTPLTAEHFLSRKATDLPGVKQLLKSDPAAAMRNILESLGGSATVQQISQWMVGDLMNEAEWKRWWDSTKKLIKSTGYFEVSTKKTEPIRLRGEKVSRADELIAFFHQARQPREQASALDQIVKLHAEFREPEKQLQPIVAEIEDAAQRNQRLNPALSFELVLGRDDLLERCPQLRSTNGDVSLGRLIRDEEPRLMAILPKLPSAKEKRVLAALPDALGENWTTRAFQLMQHGHARVAAQLPKVFADHGKEVELRAFLDRGIREHSLSSEILVWLCRERKGMYGELITPDLLGAILSAIERDQHNETSRGNRLRDLLLEDRGLMGDIFAQAEVGVARDGMRRLMLTPVFDELTKRSLLARIIKLHPELETVVTGEQQRQEKAEALIVSWSSLAKRKAEYEDLVQKKIPENTKEISVARSYGDLRENFEFKAAKQMQAVLMRRKTELEQALTNARGTSFESADTSKVSIGTIVTLKSTAGDYERYSILGAWDGDPERGIISYKTAIGQALLGKSVGARVTLNTDHGVGEYEIVAIEPAPPDVTPEDTTDFVEAEVAVAE